MLPNVENCGEAPGCVRKRFLACQAAPAPAVFTQTHPRHAMHRGVLREESRMLNKPHIRRGARRRAALLYVLLLLYGSPPASFAAPAWLG